MDPRVSAPPADIAPSAPLTVLPSSVPPPVTQGIAPFRSFSSFSSLAFSSFSPFSSFFAFLRFFVSSFPRFLVSSFPSFFGSRVRY